MPRTIVLDDHTLGVIYPNDDLQVLHSSILRGSPYVYPPYIIPFNPVLQVGRFRSATEQDFKDFGVVFHTDYLAPIIGDVIYLNSEELVYVSELITLTKPLAYETKVVDGILYYLVQDQYGCDQWITRYPERDTTQRDAWRIEFFKC